MLGTGSGEEVRRVGGVAEPAISICNCCILYLGANRFMICGTNVVLGQLEMLWRKEVVKKGSYRSVLTSGVFTCPRQLHDW